MNTEVIMAAYNNEKVMRLVLEGYLNQKDKSFTLCIADDGSGSQIKDMAKEFSSRGLKVRHIWQEDKGFRKARIMNSAIASSNADYIIMTDNDCIPSRSFVIDHKQWAKEGCYVAGRRVDLESSLTQRLLSGELQTSRLESLYFVFRQSLAGGLKRAEVALRPPRWLAELWSRKEQGLLGANIGAWRKDLVAVNGFDRDFEGYGSEESDLEWRLKKSGLKSRPARGRACLFHLYHIERSASAETLAMLREKKSKGIVFAERGITSNV